MKNLLTRNMLTLGMIILLGACETANNTNSDVHASNSNIVDKSYITSTINKETPQPIENHINSLLNTDMGNTVNESDLAYAPITEYAYAASGNKIEVFRIESTGQLKSTNFSISPSGLSSGAKISSIAIAPDHLSLYATIKNGSSDDKIWMLGLNATNGKLKELTKPLISTHKTGTSSVTVSQNSMFVYTTDSTQVCTYKIQDNYGKLTSTPYCISPLLDNKVYPYQQITLSANGKYAFVTGGPTNHSTIFTLKREANGTLSYVSQPKLDTKAAYNLSMAIPESGKFLYTALKSNNAVGTYKIDQKTGSVSSLPNQLNIGAGSEPHSVVITPNRKYTYVANYNGNTISQFSINADGTLKALIPATVDANGGPDKIVLDKSGTIVYVSTKDKHILQYQIDYSTGQLLPLANTSIPVWESSAVLAVTNLEALNMNFISPTYTYDIPLTESFIVNLSAGMNPSSIIPENITACQRDENTGKNESDLEVVTTSSTNCPTGYTLMTVLALKILSPTLLSLEFKDLKPEQDVLISSHGIIDASGNLYEHQLFKFNTTVSVNKMTTPYDGTTNASPDTDFDFTFTKDIEPDSPDNKVIITEFMENGEQKSYTVPGIGSGTHMSAKSPIRFTEGSEIELTAMVSSKDGSEVLVSTASTHITEEESEKLIIYVARGPDINGDGIGDGYTGNLAQYYDPQYVPESHVTEQIKGVLGADIECNKPYNKPANRQDKQFRAIIDTYTYSNFLYGLLSYTMFLNPNTVYYNVNEEVITTTNDQGWFIFYFTHAIGITHHDEKVWTGLTEYGQPVEYNSCSHWTKEDAFNNFYADYINNMTHAATVGNSAYLDISAISFEASQKCQERHYLYCAQIS